MQKRTNPLELKVDAKDYTPAPLNSDPKTETASAPHEKEEPHFHDVPPAPAAVEVSSPSPTVSPAVSPAAPSPAQSSEAKAAAEKAEEPISSAPLSAAETAPEQEKSATAAEASEAGETSEAAEATSEISPDCVAPVRPNRPAPPRPVRHNPAEDRIRHGEHIADNDVSVAVKFRVAGDRVERRMVLARVSKDVCKLAQALYPEQSLGSIIEGALLTRAFLQDRDAFDAAAREIIKKGGKIKC